MDRSSLNSWRHSSVALLLAMWLGGVAFYAAIVVPTGAAVLGNHTDFGFITRRVTVGINVFGSAVVFVLLCNLAVRATRPLPKLLWPTLAVMIVCQGALWALHPWLDALLDPEQRHVVDRVRFYDRHRVYLLTTMVQWLAGVLHFRAVWTWSR